MLLSYYFQFFLFDKENVMYVSVISRHANWSSDFSASFSILSYLSLLEPICKTIGIYFGALYLGLQIPYVAPQYSIK